MQRSEIQDIASDSGQITLKHTCIEMIEGRHRIE